MIVRRTVKFQRKQIGPDRLDKSMLKIVTWCIGFGEIVIEDWLEAQYTCDKIPDCVLTRTMAKLMYLYELMEQQRLTKD